MGGLRREGLWGGLRREGLWGVRGGVCEISKKSWNFQNFRKEESLWKLTRSELKIENLKSES